MKRTFFLAAVFLILLHPIISQEEKLVITILDFSTEEVSNIVMETIVDRLSSSLFQTAKYTIIDTQKRDALIDEMKFTLSGLTDESSVIEVGKLLAAEAIVMGSLGKVGSKYVLSSKMLETETGKTLYTADGTYRDLEGMLDDIPRIAGLLSGTVKGKLVYEKDTPEYKKRVTGLSLIGSGAAVAGAAGYFFVSGGLMLNAAKSALDSYNAIEAGSPAAEFDTAYATYLDAFDKAESKQANTQVIAGSIGTAVGLIAAGIGTYMVITVRNEAAGNESEDSASIGFNIQPTAAGTRVSMRIAY